MVLIQQYAFGLGMFYHKIGVWFKTDGHFKKIMCFFFLLNIRQMVERVHYPLKCRLTT